MSEKNQLLKKIYELGFAVNDMTLYLDTHPEDTDACAKFHQLLAEKNEAMQTFESEHYPLCVSSMSTTKNGWAWGDAPAPWLGGMTNVEL